MKEEFKILFGDFRFCFTPFVGEQGVILRKARYCQDRILPKSLSNSSYVIPMVGENIFREALHSDYNGKIRLSRSNFSEKLNTRLQGRIFCSMPSVATYAAAGVGLVAVGLYLVR